MKRRIGSLLAIIFIIVLVLPAAAQDAALNLPADLYVLLNDGVVQRYALGAAGAQTVTPPGEFVIDFAVDSQGEKIAYRTQEGLKIAMLGDAQATLQLVDSFADVPPLRGRGETVVWSPNGDAIAYTTLTGARIYSTTLGIPVAITQAGIAGLEWSPDGQYLLAETDGNIWWVYGRDGSSFVLRAALPSSVGIDWINEGVLVFTPEDGGLMTMDLNQRNAQNTLQDSSEQYRLPQLAPDGRLLFFRRDPSDETVPAGYGQLAQLLPGSTQAQTLGVAPIDLTGSVRWAPGATLLVAFKGGIIALFDPRTGDGFQLPVDNAVAYAWGPHPPEQPLAATAEAAAPSLTPPVGAAAAA